MKMIKVSQCLTLLFLISGLLCPVKGQVSLSTCTDLGTVKIAIPSILTHYSRSLNFGLKYEPLRCEHGVSIRTINVVSGYKGRKIQVQDSAAVAYFLKDGSLLVGSTYYFPKDYCIKEIRSDGLSIEFCPHPCGGITDSICVPKCCDLDKVVDIYGKSCQFSDQRWAPIIYNFNETFKNNKAVTLGGNTSQTLLPLRVVNISLGLNYEIRRLDCGSENPLSWSLRNLSRFGYQNTQFRFLENGSALQWSGTEWNLLPPTFCLDGLQNYGMSLFYTGSVFDQLLKICPQDLKRLNVDMNSRSTTNVLVSVAYGLVMFCSCFLLTMTLLVYFLLRKKQKFQILVVSSYVFSLLLLNIFFGTSNILSQLGTSSGNMMVGTTSCILIGAAAHLLILSTFIWLTFINLNIWATFRKLISQNSLSIHQHGLKRFLLFSLFSWGTPTVVVVTGLILDYTKRVQAIEWLPSPGYGRGRCLISIRSEGVFLFYPIGILILFNAFIFLATVIRIAIYQKLTKQIIGRKSDRQWRLIRVYSMLLISATILWLTEFVSWFLGLDATILYWILIDVLNLSQSFLIFVIFVCGRNTCGNLGDKYPVVKKASMYFSMKQRSAIEKETLVSKSKTSSH